MRIIIKSIPVFRKGDKKPGQVFSTFPDITKLKKLSDEKQRLKDEFEQQVKDKTRELNQQIGELEHFSQVPIKRELQMEELRKENEL